MFLSDQKQFKMPVSLSHSEYITADSIEDLHQQKTPQGAENETGALEEQATMSIISDLSVSLKKIRKSSTSLKRDVFLFSLEWIVSNSQFTETQLPSSIIEFRAEEIVLIYARPRSIG